MSSALKYACGECGKPIKTGCYCKECSEAEKGSRTSNERTLGEPDLALDRDGPYCNEHLNDVRAWCAECIACTNERKRDVGSHPNELVTRRTAPSEITKRGALIEELTEIGHKLADDRGNRVPPAVTTVMQVQDLARRLTHETECRHPVLTDNPDQPWVNDYICARCRSRVLVTELVVYESTGIGPLKTLRHAGFYCPDCACPNCAATRAKIPRLESAVKSVAEPSGRIEKQEPLT